MPLGTTTGSPASASSPGAVPMAKVAMMAPGEERRTGREGVDLDGLGEAAGQEERGRAEARGPRVRVGAGGPATEPEPVPDPHGERRRPGRYPRRQAGEPCAEDRHHQRDRDHQHGGHLRRQGDAGADGAEGSPQHAVADDPAGHEHERRPHLRAEPAVAGARGRSTCLEPRGEREDEAADEGHAGRHPCREAEEQRHREAAAAQVAGTRGEIREPRDLREHRESTHENHAGDGRKPDVGVTRQPRRRADRIAGSVDRLRDRGGGDGRRARDLHPSTNRRGADVLDVRKTADVALDAHLARTARHPRHGHGRGERFGRGGRRARRVAAGRGLAFGGQLRQHAVDLEVEEEVGRQGGCLASRGGRSGRRAAALAVRGGPGVTAGHRDACSSGRSLGANCSDDSVEGACRQANPEHGKRSSRLGQAGRARTPFATGRGARRGRGPFADEQHTADRSAARGRQGRLQAAGRSSTKVAPVPGPALSAQARPPIASASARTIARPIPDPPDARLRAASTR